MFGLGLPEIIIILVVALLVVGPSKLPELARSLGKAFNDFKRMADEVKETFDEEVVKEVDEIKKFDVMAETETPPVKEESVSADKKEELPYEAARIEGPAEKSVEGPVPPVQHAKEEESNEQSGTHDTKAT